MRGFDPLHGGFGHAPKFPHPMDLKVLLRYHVRSRDSQALHIVRHTLDKMARGGIYDHLGGGFARYSTDDRWLVPHFEKMLYDNALLTSVYLEAYQLTARCRLRPRRARDDGLRPWPDDRSRGCVLFDRGRRQRGGRRQVLRLVARRSRPRSWVRICAKTFCYVYDVTEQGNWEEHNILNLPRTIGQAAKLLGRDEDDLRTELAASRAQLLSVREGRVPPAKDTKVLVSWNGLMIAALAEGGRILKDERYIEAAQRAAGFILERMRRDDGRLLHTYKDNLAKLDAYLDDYADLIDGLTRLYEATGEPHWIDSALGLAQVMIDEFGDREQGGFFFTGNRHEALIARQKDVHDNATPSGNGMAATALVRLGALTGRDDLTQAGRKALESVHEVLERQPAAAGQSLIALDFLLRAGSRARRDRGLGSRRVSRGPGSHRDAFSTSQSRCSRNTCPGGMARR